MEKTCIVHFESMLIFYMEIFDNGSTCKCVYKTLSTHLCVCVMNDRLLIVHIHVIVLLLHSNCISEYITL